MIAHIHDAAVAKSIDLVSSDQSRFPSLGTCARMLCLSAPGLCSLSKQKTAFVAGCACDTYTGGLHNHWAAPSTKDGRACMGPYDNRLWSHTMHDTQGWVPSSAKEDKTRCFACLPSDRDDIYHFTIPYQTYAPVVLVVHSCCILPPRHRYCFPGSATF